jgi:hypothetical protein
MGTGQAVAWSTTTTKKQVMSYTTILPGEEVLVNRVRHCIPAAVQDRLIPANDQELAHRMRKTLCVKTLTVKTAQVWLRVFVREHANEMEATEKQMLTNRLHSHFPQEAL